MNVSSTAGTADSLMAELLRLPKEPADDLEISTGGQARTLGLITAGLGLVAAVLAIPAALAVERVNPWLIASIIFFSVTLNVGVVAACFGAWEWMSSRQLQRLRNGMYHVRWRYAPQQWDGFVASESGRFRRITGWVVHGIFLVGGLLVALLVHLDDGTLVGGSALLHYIGTAAIALAAGAVVTLVCRRLAGQTERLRRTRTAQCIVGAEGLYLTGLYWPWQAIGQRLEGVHCGGDDPGELSFVFRVKTRHGSQTSHVHVPVPPGERAVAEAVVRLLASAAQQR